MPHRAIVARRQALRVAMDRLPAARDKTLKIIGSFLGAKMEEGLSARGRSGGGQVDRTVRRRRRALRHGHGRCRRGRSGVLLVRTLGIDGSRGEERVVHRAARVLRGGSHLCVDGVSERVGNDVRRRGSGDDLWGSVQQGLHLRDVLDDEL